MTGNASVYEFQTRRPIEYAVESFNSWLVPTAPAAFNDSRASAWLIADHLQIAVLINLFVIAIMAKGFYGTDEAESVGLFSAGDYIAERVSNVKRRCRDCLQMYFCVRSAGWTQHTQTTSQLLLHGCHLSQFLLLLRPSRHRMS